MWGAGRIGGSIALDLAESGLFGDVTLVGRGSAPPGGLGPTLPEALRYVGRASLSGSVRALGRCAASAVGPAEAEARGARAIVFCVPDAALTGAVTDWAALRRAGGVAAARVALHTSGVRGSEILESLRELGSRVAAWHPLVAVAAPGRGRFRGAFFGVEGDDEAVSYAGELARALDGRALPVDPDAHARCHAAAVFASNYLACCLAVASELWGPRQPGASASSLEALLPLARSALENVARTGVPGGLTGPLVRGEIGTIHRHLDALDPATRDLYRALGAELLRVGGADLPVDVRCELRRLLTPGGRVGEPEGGASDGE